MAKNIDNRTPEWRAKDAFFAEAIANLRAVKPHGEIQIMHVKSGLYDDEKALDVFNVVRGLMRHLATELREVQ